MESEIYGLTCNHVIPNDLTFQQPSLHTILIGHQNKRQKTRSEKLAIPQTILAGSTCGIGIYSKNKSDRMGPGPYWLDYQLLKLNRDLAVPLNMMDGEKGVVLKQPAFELEFYNFRDIEQKFSKFGAATGLTRGYLYNGGRQDCFLKVIYQFYV
jgi:hypothetical protein